MLRRSFLKLLSVLPFVGIPRPFVLRAGTYVGEVKYRNELANLIFCAGAVIGDDLLLTEFSWETHYEDQAMDHVRFRIEFSETPIPEYYRRMGPTLETHLLDLLRRLDFVPNAQDA